MALDYYQGTGRRKRASARVRMYAGNGKIVVNDLPMEEYFTRVGDQRAVLLPLEASGLLGTVNVTAYLAGTVVVAALSTRVALVPLMRIGLFFSTAGVLLASVAQSSGALAIALAVMGLGGAAIWIPSPRVATGALRPERRGRSGEQRCDRSNAVFG